MDVISALAMFALLPSNFVLRKNGLSQAVDVNRSQIPVAQLNLLAVGFEKLLHGRGKPLFYECFMTRHIDTSAKQLSILNGVRLSARSGVSQMLCGVKPSERLTVNRASLLRHVSLIAILTAAPLSAQAQFAAEESANADVIIVTARKRTENIQNTPESVQALGQARIEQLNLKSFDDYVRFTPSLSFVSQGPGQSKMVIRGIAESTGSAEGGGRSSAALYLDEQPITVDGSSPDPRLVDIERIEVLSGPQGTLYGASSESGTVRIITNKPDVTKFGGYVEATGRTMAEGEASYDFNGAVNIPIVQDKLALRITGYSVKDGGFIDIVPGETPGGTANNAGAVADDVNASETNGARVAARWEINDNWRATASYVFQDVDVDGRSDYDPALGDLQAVRFFKESYKDKWNQSALTLEGDLSFAKLVVTGAYFDRKTRQIDDGTAYDQYLTTTAAYFPLYDFGADPTGFVTNTAVDRRTTAEIRLSSNEGPSRWSWIVGGFYEEAETGYSYANHITDFANSQGFANAQAALAAAAAPLLSPTDIYFYQTSRYNQEQTAVFGEISYKITDKLTATIGGRWYSVSGGGDLHTELPFGAAATVADLGGLPVVTLEDSVFPFDENGFTPKFNLSYQATPNVLLYGTYSQGFRLGGANRQRLGLAVPVQYSADELKNFEAGWKTQWLDGRVTLNGAAFFMSWEDFFSDVRNPDPSTFFFVTANVGDAEVKGLELEYRLKPTSQLEIGGSATFLNAELSKASAAIGVPKGARLPVSPEVKFAMFGQYTIPIAALKGEAYIRADYSYTGESVNSIDPTVAQKQAAYEIVNFQAGFERADWRVNFFLNNAFDERAALFVNPNFYDSRVTSNRPRELGLTVSRQF